MQSLDRVLLTVDDVRRITGVSRASLYRQMAEGRLLYRRVAGRRRVFTDDLKVWMRGERAA